MSKVKVAINGMGRIGRTIFREYFNKNIKDFEIVAVNSPGSTEEYIHLIKYDSIHGKFPQEISYSDNKLIVQNKKISFYRASNPEETPWFNDNVDIVIDASGVFKDKESLGKHMKNSVKKVIMCAPGKNLDGTFVVGINHTSYNPKAHHIISNASCTTNCLAPIAKVLHENFDIESGVMTTIHSFTSDQKILDSSHSDLRRSRTASMSLIPTTTGAARSIGTIIPELDGKIDGFAIRVPTPNVSLVDFTCNVSQETDAESVNRVLKKASENELKNILSYETLPLVSIDYNGKRESSCIDSEFTSVLNKKVVKTLAWYDNEVGFSNRILDLVSYIAKQF